MRGTERVIYVNIGQTRERSGEIRVVLRLARLEADVLEQQHVSRGQCVGERLHLLPDPRRGELHLGAEQLRQPSSDRLKRQAGIWAFRPAEVGYEDQRRAALAERPNRRQRGPDPGVVGDPPLLEWNVEVDPHEDSLVP